MKMNSPKKQAFLKAVSFFLATAVTFNVLSLTAISAASVSDNLTYVELNDAPELYGELPDSSELEKMYLEQLFYGNGSSLYKDYGRTDLTGVPLEIYEFLRDKIEKVASGELTETVFTYTFPDFYTDADVFNRDFSKIHRHLLNDLPQSFYWFDKTVGIRRLSGFVSDGVDLYLHRCEFQFTVSENYAAENDSGGKEPHKVDPSKINSAKTAVTNAQDIAAKYSGLSDYEKIIAYKKEICALTEYDHNAASGVVEVPYGDPWQIVYVFDGDNATNVVCEGYSKAFQYLCDLGGVECYTVTGEMRGGTGAGPHMWNIAVLNGVSYLVDITNCDDGSAGAPDLLLLKGADKSSADGCTFVLYPNNTINYTYDDNSRIYPDDILKVAERAYNPEIHSHTVCAGAEGCPAENEIIENWTEWIDTASLPSETGYYYLSENVTLSGTWTVTENIHLCLNGKTVYASDPNAEAILIEALGVLDLCDCSKNGSISRSVQSSDGSGVVNRGIFNMYSGNVSGHYAQYGGGVKNENEFNMYGGTISGNSAEEGGGVYTAEHIFRMCGGTVGENTALSVAGGVYISGGEVVLSGSAVIQGNLINGNANNLYIPSGNKVTLSEPLSEKANIGVTTEDIPAKGAPVTFTAPNNNDYRKLFGSDNDVYKTVNTDKKAIGLSLASLHEHKLCINTKNCPDSEHIYHGETVSWTPWTDTTRLPSSEGYYYLTQDVVLTKSHTLGSGTVSLCLNGHSVTVDPNTVNAQNPMEHGLIVIDSTAGFNLCDCESQGKICGNYTSDNGGGVYNRGRFNMYSGEISENTSLRDGGAVYNNNTFYMYGGIITANSAVNGGGTAGAGDTFICGGEIIGNTVSVSGGGVYADGSNVTVGGETFIRDNKLGGASNDLYLAAGTEVTVDSDNPLTENAYIGVTVQNIPDANDFVNITGENGGNYSAFFYSNNIDCKIVTGENNRVQLALRGQHDHTLCANTENCPDNIHAAHESLKWLPIDNGTGLPTAPGNYYLTEDIKVTESWTPVDGETSICLNGFAITVDTGVVNSTAPMEHSILYIYREGMTVGDVVFNLCDCEGGGKITGNYTSGNGGGVYNGGTFNMFSGEISRNTTRNSGGGIYNIGVFNMYSGEISGNTASSYGGGVSNYSTFNMYNGEINGNSGYGMYMSGNAAFNMYDGEISGNLSYGIHMGGGAAFNMYDGKISGNSSYGMYMSGNAAFNMYDGEISGNSSYGIHMSGGAAFNMYDGKISGNSSCGVYTNGNGATFNMYDGEISGNTASVGGGVYLTGTGDIFNMFGGKIVKNTATNHGGGLCNLGSGCTFKMTGGVITENFASGTTSYPNSIGFGGGAHTHENTINIIGGDAVIYGNSAKNNVNGQIEVDDLYLQEYVTIKVDPPFTENAHVGIRTHYAPPEGGRIQFTERSDTDYTDFFECNDPQCAVQNIDNVLYLRIPPHEHTVCVGADSCTDCDHELIEWTKWESATSLPTRPGNYFLTKNYINLSESWTPPAGETSICLNGCRIILTSSANSENPLTNGLINIDSDDITLNLCDCTGRGMINYNSSAFSGSTVYNDGIFNMYGGLLGGNRSTDNGCIYNNGTFNMSGGKITENYAGYGGVYNVGTFNMQGGEISGNSSKNDGCGMLISGSDSEFNMLGGKITENISQADGGGVYVDGGTFNMLGGEISGNRSYHAGGGVCVDSGIFNMLGGKINENNSVYNAGAGVYVNSSNTVILGGKIVIKDNKHSGGEENLYIKEGVTVATDPDSPIERGSYIGVTTQLLPDNNTPDDAIDDYPVNVTDENNRDYRRVFYSDNPLYEVANSKNNEIQLVTYHVHSLVRIEAADPTCLLPGNEEYYVCERCFEVFKDIHAEIPIGIIPEDIEALGHLYGDWTITIEPTEEEDSIGEAIKICERDESHVRRVVLTTLIGDMWEKIEDIPSTCFEEGKRVYRNEYGTVTVNLKKLSHDYESEKWHSDEEKHWQECKNCGTANPYSEKTHEWDEGKITVAPTTEHDGEKIFTCGICGHTRTEKLPKLKPPVTTPSETEPPVTPPSETNPPVTPPSETEPPVTPPSETEPPVTPPSETEPPVTPPSETDPPVTPPSETDPPVTPPSETDPPITPPSETDPPVTPPSETAPPITPPSETNPPVTPPVSAAVTTYSFVVPVTSGTTAAAQTSPANDSIFSLEFINEDTTTPPTDVAGSISKRVESPDYAAEISDSVQELANNVLEQQEIALVNSGGIIEILLTIDKINTVPAVDGSAIAEKLNGYKMWQYLDINLYKIIDGTQYKLSGTNAPVTIKVVIPETLRTAGRRYAIIRIHDGAVDVLNDLDTNASTITFTTDRFSIYALIYKDKEISNDEPMNTGVDSYTAIFLAAGITALPVSMAFTVIGSGIMGMSEASKNRVYEKIIRWGKGGGKARKAIALALIFLLLSYYYTVGNKAQAEGQS